MDIQTNLIRRTVNIAVSKALDDMKNDTERSARNLVDLGLFFAKEPIPKWFFTTAQQILTKPDNSYHQLIKRMIANVNIETLKTCGINLGYNSLTSGTKLLRKQEKILGHHIPWLVVFTLGDQVNISGEKIAAYINESNDLGIYSYLFNVESTADFQEVIALAAHFNNCAIMISLPPKLITTESVTMFREAKNILISVKVEETPEDKENRKKAFQVLHSYNCLFGYQTLYNEGNAPRISSIEFMQAMIDHYCSFGVYIADPATETCYLNSLDSFISSVRGGNGQPIIAFDWHSDTQFIANSVSPGSDYLVISSKGETSCGQKKYPYSGAETLTEIIKQIMPRI